MENPRCQYRHPGFTSFNNSNSFSAFTNDNLHDGSGQCWMEGEHVGNFSTEEEPEYFCIFHAPENKEPPPGFSKADREARQPSVLKDLLNQWNEVNEKLEKRKRLTFVLSRMRCFEAELDNIAFSHNVDFDNAIFIGDTSFINATFIGHASFDDATFNGATLFSDITFNGYTSFDSATFSDNALFDDVTFNGDAIFYNTKFSGNASFDKATFNGDTLFRNATFSGDASFDDATFSGDASFHAVEFNGRAYFENCKFKRYILLQANIIDKGCWFTKSKFNNLEYSVHQGEKIFFNACSGRFTFTDQDCAKLSFLNMDLSNADFLGADIKNTRFDACRWKKPRKPSYSIVHQHKDIIDKFKKSRNSDNEAVKEESEDGIIKLRSLYLQLKRNLEESHSYRQAGEFHYREMEIREMQEKSWLDKPMLWLYRKLADYGESWAKLGLCLFLSFPLFAGFVFGWEWRFGDGLLTYWQAFEAVFLAVVPSVFRKGVDYCNLHGVSEGIVIFETVTALVLAALFAMAVRRRFRR